MATIAKSEQQAPLWMTMEVTVPIPAAAEEKSQGYDYHTTIPLWKCAVVRSKMSDNKGINWRLVIVMSCLKMFQGGVGPEVDIHGGGGVSHEIAIHGGFGHEILKSILSTKRET